MHRVSPLETLSCVMCEQHSNLNQFPSETNIYWDAALRQDFVQDHIMGAKILLAPSNSLGEENGWL
jgi:hypothetical protein